MSTITLKQVGENLDFECENSRGGKLHLSASADLGGIDTNFRPMEALLASLVGCSSIDILNILQKQKYHPHHFSVTVTGEREDGAIPAVFTKIHLAIEISKDVNEAKLMKAIELTQEKYCSVLFMIQSNCEINYTYVLK